MKNVLFISPYKDSNGLGTSGRKYIDCLTKHTDINLAIRPLFLTNSHMKNPLSLERYSEFENNSFAYYDYVIQHGFPEIFVCDHRFGKNIGLVEIETSNIHRSGWVHYLNNMDEVLINSLNGIRSAENAGATVPLRLMPEPYDIVKYEKSYDPFFTYDSENKPFIFYIIGQYSEKKNIKSIILAYLLEFNQNDNVRLFIKTGDQTLGAEDLNTYIEFDIAQIKKGLRKPFYCDIDIVSGYLSDQDIIRLHRSADCYINACRADGLGPCAIEAMLSNKIVINTKHIGSSTYFNSSNALMVDAAETNVFSPNFINPRTLTVYEKWHEPNISSIQQKMRQAYEMTNQDKNELINNYNKQYFDSSNIIDMML